MVAGEEQLFFLEQIAQVVRRMAGRVHHAQRRRAGQRKDFAAGQRHIGAKARILPLRVIGDAAVRDGPGARLQGHRRGRMVHVRVGREDPADRPGRGGEDGLDMRLGQRAGVDHRPFVGVSAADQIGVGAGPGHHAAVVGADADHTLRKPHRNKGPDLVADLAVAEWIEPANLGPGGRTRHHRLRPLAAAADARHDERDLARLARPGERLFNARKALEKFQRMPGRVHQLQGLAARDRIDRPQPLLLDHLGAVVRAGLRRRRGGDEEAGIEALGAAERRQPVAEVHQPVDRQPDAGVAAELADAALAAVQRLAPGGQAFFRRRVELDQPVVRIDRDQQSGLLEALAQRGDVVVQAAFGQAERSARLRIVEAGAHAVRGAVRAVDQAAREDPGTAVVVAALGTPAQQHLDAVGGVANDGHGGGGTGRAGSFGHGRIILSPHACRSIRGMMPGRPCLETEP